MKNNLLLLLLVIAATAKPFLLSAQSPNWLWAKSAGGTSYDYGFSCTNDASGNTIVTGSFQSSTITFGTTVLTNGGNSDMFIVKYDLSGNVLWAQSAGGWSFDGGYSCSTDTSGNIFVTGSFNSSTITFGTIILTGTDSPDIFIVKYDPSGNVLWAKAAGDSSWTDTGSGCSTDASGNVIVTGQFQSPTITFDTIVLTCTGSPDMFIVKCDPNGNVLWAKSAGGTYTDAPNGCSTDTSGNIIAIGDFASPTITFGTTTLTNAGNNDIFIVKYDTSGNVLWAKSAGGASNDRGMSCTTDASGNILAIGYFESPSVTFGTTVLTNAGFATIYIVKYDTSGNVLWAKSAAGGTSYGTSCATDANGNIIATGSFFSPTLTIDTTILNNADFSGNTGDIFTVKYDISGNVLWAKSAGGTSTDAFYGCSTDISGNIIVTGDFQSSPITFGTTTLTNAGNNDMFIAKLNGTVTGIDEIGNSGYKILLFPNPATNHLTIALESNNKNVAIIITDVTGKIINSTNATEIQRIEVNTKDFAEGIYIVHIQAADVIATKKFIVAK